MSVVGTITTSSCKCMPPIKKASIVVASNCPTNAEPINRSMGRESKNVCFGNDHIVDINPISRRGRTSAKVRDGISMIAIPIQFAELTSPRDSDGNGKKPATKVVPAIITTSGIQKGFVSNVFICRAHLGLRIRSSTSFFILVNTRRCQLLVLLSASGPRYALKRDDRLSLAV